MISFFIEAEFSPFTAGANDNASAAGMVLTMAEKLNSSDQFIWSEEGW
jgi:Zn-dependent M28 family amino/carboxypeptidase